MDFGQALLNSFQTVLGAAENAAPGWQALQDQQAQRADVQAQTQSRQLGNYEKQMQIAQQKKFQDFQSRMQALGQDSDAPDPKNPDSVADHLAKEGEQYIDSGYINEGSKLLQESTRLRTLNMNARRAGAQAVLEQVKVEKAKNEGAAASLYGVTNEEEFRSAVKGTKLEDMPWEGPTTVQKARERLMSPEFQLKEKEAAAKERDRSEQREIQKKKEQDQVKYWTEQNRIRAEAGKTKAGKEAKNSTAAPTAEETKRARDLVLNSYPEMKSNDEALAAAATSIAADAKKRMQGNPALPWDTAVHQAMTARANSFKDIGKGTTFVGGGDSAEEALPMPKTAIDDRDPKDLTKDKWYTWPSGRVAQWTGTGWRYQEGDDTPPDEEDKSEWDDDDKRDLDSNLGSDFVNG